MISKLIFILLFKSTIAFAGDTTTYVLCKSSAPDGSEVSDWALDDDNRYLKIEGYWKKEPSGISYFLADRDSYSDLKTACEHTILKKRGEHYQVSKTIEASNSIIRGRYPIHFTAMGQYQTLCDIKVANAQIIDQFLPMMFDYMNSDNYEDSYYPTVDSYVRASPENSEKLVPYLKKAQKFSKDEIQFTSDKPSAQVSAWIDRFSKASDYEILSDALKGTDVGAYRGSLNTFADLVVESLKPESEKRLSSTPPLFQEGNDGHKKTFIIAQAFSSFVEFKGILNRLDSEDSDLASMNESMEQYRTLISVVILKLENLKPHFKVSKTLSEQLSHLIDSLTIDLELEFVAK
jgi:hypothetical protein